jgi:gamma-glutamylcyclotransferase
LLYFAYGMNTNSQGMARRCPAAVSHGHAVLLDHVFRFAGPADVVKCSDSYVDGVLWTITPECLKALDNLEGFPHYYNRRNKRVLHQGRVVNAMTYFMQPGHLDSPPSDGYFNMVLEGYKEHGVLTDQLYNSAYFSTTV